MRERAAVYAIGAFLVGGWAITTFDLCGRRSGTSPVPDVPASPPREGAAVTPPAPPRPPREAEAPAVAQPRAHWYQGGTLHRAKAAEWNRASYENKLATAGDFLANLWLNKRLKPKVASNIHGVDDLAPWAAELVVAIDKAFSGPPESNATTDVSSAAVLLMAMMGWT